MKAARLVGFSLVTGIAVLAGSGCASSSGKKVVPHSHSGQLFKVELGTVLSVREVTIEGSADTNVGQWGGAIMGGTLASGVGSGGYGTAVASAVGAVGGMVAGREIEKAVTKADGYEIVVQLDNGDQIMVVQEIDKGSFYDGDRVRVMIGQGTTEVLH
jgi:outer membrane lipoprotein SlyB